ncbi:endonuclease/exonuclease/phosphatase family protein [Croceivirga thetidis]|uniref:Endonuclease/exonuclease/phosphatase family protein n=1 Tax=Croceivirga thetidis TaxID=2721623 RepID=A0ABX1GNG6_9FLAO|nr:endonuclease/exonuclease/phosphatase family protein [Croceivirga thetidis]NKI31460.1 endonuclease/exonuclease/phosphatase family protein [Croceivirga thetidis]
MRICTVSFVLIPIFLFAQEGKVFSARTIAFYNVENLFDTRNDSLIFDDDRTPNGAFNWTKERYERKILAISNVISEVGYGLTKSSPDIIGLCEVENIQVIRDLINQPNLISKNYGIVHFDSPDDRGIDVALIYKKEAFIPNNSRSHRLLLFDVDDKRDYTRDQLVVSGFLDDEEFHFIVNHWPSRRGGRTRSEPLRIKAAELTKRILDSIYRIKPSAKIITMGDFNDDPKDRSLKKVLRTKGRQRQLDSLSLFNPMDKFYKKGAGTLAYRDKWNLFDQLILTPNLLEDATNSFTYWKAGIYNPKYLQNTSGKYKGYPYRTYVGTTYQGGYSDHFPVYLILIKENINPSN